MKMKPVSTIKAELGIEPTGPVHRHFTETCYKKMNKYVPKGETGNLRDITDRGVDYITYEMPYAHAQYIGIVNGSPVRNYTTPGTGPYWDKRMWSAEGEQVVKEVQDYVRKRK